MKTVIAVSTLMLLAACHEIPQDAAKSFAGENETKSYSAPLFNGDKAAYEKAMAKRADTQNEYLRVPN